MKGRMMLLLWNFVARIFLVSYFRHEFIISATKLLDYTVIKMVTVEKCPDPKKI